MKYFIILSIVLITNGCGYGQYPKLKLDKGKVYNANAKVKPVDTFYYDGGGGGVFIYDSDKMPSGDTPIVLYGIGGIQDEPFDSAKYYFHKFLYFTEKMDKAHGKNIDRYEDSCIKYYKLLYKPKK